MKMKGYAGKVTRGNFLGGDSMIVSGILLSAMSIHH
jgi:hypothetical protein